MRKVAAAARCVLAAALLHAWLTDQRVGNSSSLPVVDTRTLGSGGGGKAALPCVQTPSQKPKAAQNLQWRPS